MRVHIGIAALCSALAFFVGCGIGAFQGARDGVKIGVDTGIAYGAALGHKAVPPSAAGPADPLDGVEQRFRPAPVISWAGGYALVPDSGKGPNIFYPNWPSCLIARRQLAEQSIGSSCKPGLPPK